MSVPQNKDVVVSGINITEMMKLLPLLERAVKIPKDNGVLFLGNTGAGKSTTICYLLGCVLRLNSNSHVVLDDNCEINRHIIAPKIGTSKIEAETLYPQAYEAKFLDDKEQKSIIPLVDFPGFEGAREKKEQRIFESLSTEVAIKSLKSIKKIIIAIDVGSLNIDRASSFVNLTKMLTKFLPGILFKSKQSQVNGSSVNVNAKDSLSAKDILFLITKTEALPGRMLFKKSNKDIIETVFLETIDPLKEKLIKQIAAQQDDFEKKCETDRNKRSIITKIMEWVWQGEVPQEPKELRENKAQYVILSLMSKENVKTPYVVKTLQDSKESNTSDAAYQEAKQDIEKIILAAKSIEVKADDFAFDTYDTERHEFDQVIFRLLGDGEEKLRLRREKKNELITIKNEIKKAEERIISIDKNIKMVVSNKTKNDNDRKSVEIQIQSCQQQLGELEPRQNDYKIEIQKIASDIKINQEIITRLDTDTEILLWSPHFYEPRSLLGFFGWSRFEIIFPYRGTPIARIDPVYKKEDAKIEVLEINKPLGIYKAVYTTKFYKDGEIILNIYVKERDLEVNRRQIARCRAICDEKKKELVPLEKELKRLEAQIEKYQSRIQGMNSQQQISTQEINRNLTELQETKQDEATRIKTLTERFTQNCDDIKQSEITIRASQPLYETLLRYANILPSCKDQALIKSFKEEYDAFSPASFTSSNSSAVLSSSTAATTSISNSTMQASLSSFSSSSSSSVTNSVRFEQKNTSEDIARQLRALTNGSINAQVRRQLIEAFNVVQEAYVKQRSSESDNKLAKQLNTEANLYGYQCSEVPRDGNCFFHAVADQIRRKELTVLGNHEYLRRETAQYITDNIDQYRSLIPGNHEEYIKQSKQNGSWVDYVHALALSRAFNLTIVILRSDSSTPNVFKQRDPVGTVVIGYEVGLHYQSVIATESKDVKPIRNLQDVIDRAEIDNIKLPEDALEALEQSQSGTITSVSTSALMSGTAAASNFGSTTQLAPSSAASLAARSMVTAEIIRAPLTATVQSSQQTANSSGAQKATPKS